MALGEFARATGADSTAIGHRAGNGDLLGITNTIDDEIRLGDDAAIVTIQSTEASHITLDNQLTNKAYVDSEIANVTVGTGIDYDDLKDAILPGRDIAIDTDNTNETITIRNLQRRSFGSDLGTWTTLDTDSPSSTGQIALNISDGDEISTATQIKINTGNNQGDTFGIQFAFGNFTGVIFGFLVGAAFSRFYVESFSYDTDSTGAWLTLNGTAQHDSLGNYSEGSDALVSFFNGTLSVVDEDGELISTTGEGQPID